MDYPFQYPGYDMQPSHMKDAYDMQPAHHLKDMSNGYGQDQAMSNMNMGTLRRNNYASHNGTLGRGEWT